MYLNWCNTSISTLCLHLCLCGVVPVYTYDASMQALAQNGTISILLCLCLCLCLCLHRTCKLGLRKHKHKCKERKLKNSDKLSASILVTRALPFSAMLESNLVPKGSPAMRLHQIFMLLRLRTSPYAYANRTCKHPCVYACA